VHTSACYEKLATYTYPVGVPGHSRKRVYSGDEINDDCTLVHITFERVGQNRTLPISECFVQLSLIR
jgi:hypothetical protein